MSSAMVPADKLVNASMIAVILGVTKSAVSTYQARDVGFPKPLDTPGVIGIKLWDVRDIIEWRDRRSAPNKFTISPEISAYAERFQK